MWLDDITNWAIRQSCQEWCTWQRIEESSECSFMVSSKLHTEYDTHHVTIGTLSSDWSIVTFGTARYSACEVDHHRASDRSIYSFRRLLKTFSVYTVLGRSARIRGMQAIETNVYILQLTFHPPIFLFTVQNVGLKPKGQSSNFISSAVYHYNYPHDEKD